MSYYKDDKKIDKNNLIKTILIAGTISLACYVYYNLNKMAEENQPKSNLENKINKKSLSKNKYVKYIEYYKN